MLFLLSPSLHAIALRRYPSIPIARFLGVCVNQASLAAILALLMPDRKPVQLLIQD
jgi:hypothetical protein